MGIARRMTSNSLQQPGVAFVGIEDILLSPLAARPGESGAERVRVYRSWCKEIRFSRPSGLHRVTGKRKSGKVAHDGF